MNTLKPNFINYNNLSDEEARLFIGGHLNYFLDEARMILFSEKNPYYYVKAKNLKHNENDLVFINSCVEYILNLIGKYHNTRFGETALEQHKFFQRNGEQETFFTHLFAAIQEYKKTKITRTNKTVKEEISVPFLNNIHNDLKAYEGKKSFFKIGTVPIKEGQLYAAGVFYAMNFFFLAIKSNDSIKLGRLFANMVHFKNGPSYLLANAKKGGIKSGKSRCKNKEKARKLFDKHDLYNKYNGKAEAMLSAFKPILRRNRIPISDKTVKTDWIPDFSNKHCISP